MFVQESALFGPEQKSVKGPDMLQFFHRIRNRVFSKFKGAGLALRLSELSGRLRFSTVQTPAAKS
jgi:transposase-like protein